MAFIRKKKQQDKTYHYLVVNQREGAKVKQKVIAYLGRHANLEAALKAMQKRRGFARNCVEWYEDCIRRNAEQGLCHAREAYLKQFHLHKLQRLEENIEVLEPYVQKERGAQSAGSSA